MQRRVQCPLVIAPYELIIRRDSHGYVALYRHVEAIDMVFVLAIRGSERRGMSSISDNWNPQNIKNSIYFGG